jgi:hypothetical protein
MDRFSYVDEPHDFLYRDYRKFDFEFNGITSFGEEVLFGITSPIVSGFLFFEVIWSIKDDKDRRDCRKTEKD